jgi:hypothetical protein
LAELAALRGVFIGRGVDPGSLRGILERVPAHFAALCQIIGWVVSNSSALHGVFVGIVPWRHAAALLR